MRKNVIAYGLTEVQMILLESALSVEYMVSQADCVTDLIVADSVLTVINPDGTEDILWYPLYCYYMDVREKMAGTVVWIGERTFPKTFTHFYFFDSFSDFLISINSVIATSQEFYDQQIGYTDIFSFLPRRAIEEAMEEDIYVALHRKFGNNPDEEIIKRVRHEWMCILECKGRAEMLAGVYELTRWMKREKIPYRMDYEALYGMIPWLLGITDCDPNLLSGWEFRGREYVICIPKDTVPKVKRWLSGHWYFAHHRGEGVLLVTTLNRETMLVEHEKPTALDNLQLFAFDIGTGVSVIDQSILGVEAGEVILVGGRPAMGKTSFARGVEQHLTGQRKRVFFFDFICDGEEIHKDIADFEQELRASNADLAVFDHFQFLSDYDETDETADALFQMIKSLAMELHIPIIVLLQLNRDPEYRPDPVPRVTDIPHWKNIMPYIDTALLLYRRAYYDPEADRTSAMCVIEKSPHCKYQMIPLHWDDENYKFTD